MSDDTFKLSRALSGDVAHLSKELTGLDLRMMKDVEPLLIIERLRNYAKSRKKEKVVSFLDKQEKIVRARQYLLFTRDLREDISKLGIAFGNLQPANGINEELA
jgi:hypothetical protein